MKNTATNDSMKKMAQDYEKSQSPLLMKSGRNSMKALINTDIVSLTCQYVSVTIVDDSQSKVGLGAHKPACPN